MHAIKDGWVGHTLALATCNDSGGRKSRIRRSKEERKAMVESFVKKYQNLNNGNFPSLNLTHKEVGGSFYTVREIVREIIQENRVLGPAKLPPEEQNNDKLLEEFPLGSISVEPHTHLSSIKEMHIISHVSPSQYQGGNEEDVLNSNGQPDMPEHQKLELESEQVVSSKFEAISVDLESDEQHRTQVASNHHEGSSNEQLSVLVEQFRQPEHQNLNNEETGSGSEPAEEDEECNDPILVGPSSVHHQKISPKHDKETRELEVLHSAGDFPGNGHLESNSEQAANHIGQAIEKTTEYEEPIRLRALVADSLEAEKDESKELEASNSGITSMKADVMVADSLDLEKDQSKELETSKSGRTRMKADVVVEKFPLRPITKTIHGLEGKLDEKINNNRTLDQVVIKHDGKSISENSSGLMNVEVGAGQVSPTLTKMSQHTDYEAVLYAGNPSSENSNFSTTKETVEVQVSNILGEKPVNAPRGISHENLNSINPSFNNEQFIPEEMTATKNKANIQHDASNNKESSSTLDQISLGTRQGTLEKPSGSETNPLLALFKAFITAFVKFWAE